MNDKLKACPSCGKLNAKCEPSHYVNHDAFSVFCVCGTSSRYAESKEKAIEAWNTRPIEDALKVELSEANKTIAELTADNKALIEQVNAKANGTAELLSDALDILAETLEQELSPLNGCPALIGEDCPIKDMNDHCSSEKWSSKIDHARCWRQWAIDEANKGDNK